jgi:hypothetical protein
VDFLVTTKKKHKECFRLVASHTVPPIHEKRTEHACTVARRDRKTPFSLVELIMNEADACPATLFIHAVTEPAVHEFEQEQGKDRCLSGIIMSKS